MPTTIQIWANSDIQSIGNASIGYETTIQLARKGVRVYIASRSPARMQEAITKMKQTDPSVDVRSLKLDLQDFQSIRDAIAKFNKQESRLDILVNNAGVSSSQSPQTEPADLASRSWRLHMR